MLDFFISPAYAQQAPQQPSSFVTLLPMLLLIVLFYFMLIRPQMKRSKEHRQMLTQLAKGDEVVTGGGIAGVVREIGESFITVEIADNVQIKLQKQAVTSVLPKGTLKSG